MSTADIIRIKLDRAFSPAALAVVDESHMHAGHAGHRPGGESHFAVSVTSLSFDGKSRLERQRMVYAVLAEELRGGVHALRMALDTPAEAGARSPS